MIGTIRRHQTWLWVIIAGLTISSFVVFGPTNARIGNPFGRAPGDNLGSLAGRNISRADYIGAEQEVKLHYFVNYGKWPDAEAEQHGFNLEMETYYRLMLNQKEKQLGIQVSTEAVANLGRRVLLEFRAVSPDTFEERLLKPAGMTLEDFDRFLRHEMGLQQLLAAAGASGRLVTPQEADEEYRKEHQEETAQMAYFSATNFMAGVMVSADDLALFYSNRVAQYSIPNRVQVDYVKFEMTNYLPEARAQLTNLDAMVETEYQKMGTNADLLGKTTELQKTKIRGEILDDGALRLAHKAANQYATAQLDPVEHKTLEVFAAMAKTNGLKARTTEPFDEEHGPKDLVVPDTFAKTAFRLSADDPFSGDIVADDGCYVLAFRKFLPSEIPQLRDIEAKVTEDYRFGYGEQGVPQGGAGFASSLTNGLASGAMFKIGAIAAGAKVATLPPFTLSAEGVPPALEDRVNPAVFKRVAFGTPVGGASPFVPTPDGGFVLYVESRRPASEEQVKKELPDFRAYMQQARQNDAFNQWFNHQIIEDPGFMATLQQARDRAQERVSAARKPVS